MSIKKVACGMLARASLYAFKILGYSRVKRLPDIALYDKQKK